MKRILYFVTLAAVVSVTSCNDAEYGAADSSKHGLGKRAFLVESVSTSGISNETISLSFDKGMTLTLTPSLSDKTDQDVSYRLVIDEEVLNRFNRENSTGYALYNGDGLVDLGGEALIKAGKYSSDPIIVTLAPIPRELSGHPLALPIRLQKVTGDIDVTSTTSSYVYVINSPMVVTLPQFNGASGLTVADFNQTFSEFTVEMRMQVSNTSNRNRDVFLTSNGSGTMLFRFEDPQKDENGNKAHSLIQWQGEGNYLNPSLAMETDKWQHYAVTYDGSAVTIYVNGVNAGTKNVAASTVLNGEFQFLSYMGGGSASSGGHGTGDSWWRGCKILTTECRIWSVCRTADQIKNGIKSVTADSKGLEGYWRVSKDTYNEETGEFEDLTGKNHPMKTSKDFTWIENISSDDVSTDWQ